METDSSQSPQAEWCTISGSLAVPRIINGLWQLAGGHDSAIDVSMAAEVMKPLIGAGLNCFDMADHYGDAEVVVGQFNASAHGDSRLTAFTKWCPPEDGEKSFENAEAAVDRALTRMGQKSLALMQYHIWDYSDDTYLYNLSHLLRLQSQGKIQHVGLTNTDAAHLELLLHSGFRIATNQVSCSVIDRRLIQGNLASVCAEHGVGVLAYGTLLGGFLTEKWLGVDEPQDLHALNWSLRKYLRFIREAGGWAPFQRVLRCLASIAQKHGVPIAAVATRWVLDIPVVSAVIVGCRLSTDSLKYATSNLMAFSFTLEDADRRAIEEAQRGLTDIPGDCGDEYRRPPYLTATGDLSHHLQKSKDAQRIDRGLQGIRTEYMSGNRWESIAGYCRAMRFGDTIRVSGTTANVPTGLDVNVRAIGGDCPRCQTIAVLDIIAHAVQKLGGKMSDIVRTRVMVRSQEHCEAVSFVHGRVFRLEGIRPANTLVAAGLIGDEFLVEIEAEAVVGSGESVIVI